MYHHREFENLWGGGKIKPFAMASITLLLTKFSFVWKLAYYIHNS